MPPGHLRTYKDWRATMTVDQGDQSIPDPVRPICHLQDRSPQPQSAPGSALACVSTLGFQGRVSRRSPCHSGAPRPSGRQDGPHGRSSKMRGFIYEDIVCRCLIAFSRVFETATGTGGWKSRSAVNSKSTAKTRTYPSDSSVQFPQFRELGHAARVPRSPCQRTAGDF